MKSIGTGSCRVGLKVQSNKNVELTRPICVCVWCSPNATIVYRPTVASAFIYKQGFLFCQQRFPTHQQRHNELQLVERINIEPFTFQRIAVPLPTWQQVALKSGLRKLYPAKSLLNLASSCNDFLNELYQETLIMVKKLYTRQSVKSVTYGVLFIRKIH